MKKFLAILLVCLMVLGLVTGCGEKKEEPAPAPVEEGYPELNFSISTPSAEDTGKSYDIRLFIDKVTEKSGGKITFTEYFNAALAKPTQNLDAISTGLADCGTVVNLYTPSLLPLSQVSYPLPFGPADCEIVAGAMDKVSELHPEFYDEYTKNNCHVLAYKGNECYKIYSTKEIKTPADLKGMKIGLSGIYYIPWFEYYGVAAVATAAGDTYQSLKSGVIDAMFCYDSLAYEYKWNEVAGYIYNCEMGTRNNDALAFNLDVWNGLDENVQALLQECADEAYKEFHAWEKSKVEFWDKALQDAGCKETVITFEEKGEWASAALAQTDTIQMWIDDVTALGYDGKTFMHDYLHACEELGYVWAYDISKY